MMLEKFLATLTPEARADVEGWIEYDPSLGVALEVGVDWTGPEPESCEDWTAVRDGGGDGWYKLSYILQPVLEDGVMQYLVHECDSDGDWNITSEVRHDSPTFDADLSEWDYRATVKSWVEYGEWVAENGRDPIGEYTISPISERTVTVLIRVAQEDDGVHVESWSELSRDKQAPETMPKEVREYLLLAPGSMVIGSAQDISPDPNYRSLAWWISSGDSGSTEWRPAGTDRGVVQFSVTLRQERPAGEYEAELREVARANLARDRRMVAGTGV